MIQIILKILHQRGYKQFRQVANHKSPADVMAWCADNFHDEKAINHFYRIERKLHRLSFQAHGKVGLTHTPYQPSKRFLGQELIEGFRRWWKAGL